MSTEKKVGIAALIWMVSNLLSRVIGVVREAVIGRTLGGGEAADVYWASFILPDFLNYLLAGGAISIVFIPIFARYLAEEKEEEGWKSFSYIANTLALFLTLSIPILWFVLPYLAPFIAPGFSDAQLEEVVRLTRIILPAQIFHLLGGILAAAQQAKNVHKYSAMASLVYTLGIIAGGLLMSSTEGFAYGVLAGSFAGPFLVNFIGARSVGMKWSWLFSISHIDVRKYIRLSFPIMIGASIIIWDDFFLKSYGSLQGEGIVSSLQYAKTLMKVPMGVFGMAYGIALYPSLAKCIAEKEDNKAYTLLLENAKRVLFLSMAAQAVMSSMGTDLATLIYGKRLLEGQAEMIGTCLLLLSIGLWGWSIQNLLARGFYAKEDTWTPTLIGTFFTIATAFLYSFLGERYGVYGLAGASAIVISVYVIALEYALRRFFQASGADLLLFVFKMAISTAICIVLGRQMHSIAFVQSLPILVRMACTGMVVFALYVGCINVWKLKELTDVQNDLFGKIRRRLRI